LLIVFENNDLLVGACEEKDMIPKSTNTLKNDNKKLVIFSQYVSVRLHAVLYFGQLIYSPLTEETRKSKHM
jgi:hypothetical protein